MKRTPVTKVMSADPTTIQRGQPISEAYAILKQAPFHHLLDHQFTIDDAMTPDLSTLPDTATVKDAAEVLSDGAIHSVIVLDQDNRLGGIVTTTDLVQFLLEQFR